MTFVASALIGRGLMEEKLRTHTEQDLYWQSPFSKNHSGKRGHDEGKVHWPSTQPALDGNGSPMCSVEVPNQSFNGRQELQTKVHYREALWQICKFAQLLFQPHLCKSSHVIGLYQSLLKDPNKLLKKVKPNIDWSGQEQSETQARIMARVQSPQ